MPSRKGKLKFKNFFAVFVVIFWLIMVSMLIFREVSKNIEPAAYSPFLSRNTLLSDSWMGIYFNDSPVGFVHSAVEPYMIKKGQSGYLIKNRTFMHFFILKKRSKVYFNAQAIVDENYQLVNFDFELSSDMHSMKVAGRVRNNNELALEITSQNIKKEKTIELPDNKGLIIASIISPFSSFGELEIGNYYKVMVFNPFSLILEPLEVKVEEKKIIDFADEKVEAFVVKNKYRGIEQTAWVNEKGEILKQQTGLGWELRKQDAVSATTAYKEMIKSEVELAKVVSVSVDKNIPAADIQWLKIDIFNVPDDFDLTSSRQKVLSKELNKKTVLIEKESIDPLGIADIPIRQMEAYIGSSDFIQSDYPEIKELAQKIIKDQTNSYKAAVLINQWLYKNIEKTPVVSIPSAIDVLRTRQGDCNEHSVLFAALTRSCNIPTKINVGLVYTQGRFYYHAWVSVFVGQWVDMDPTFGQDIADPAHLKLIEGDITRQLDIIRVLGKIKLEVIDYK